LDEGSSPAKSELNTVSNRQDGSASLDPVLVVDDDHAITSALLELLESEGYRAVSAENGKRALELVEAGLRPSAIILDLMMPVMDGWDFRFQQLQHQAIRDTPVVILTATGFSRHTIRIQFGDVELVPKPPPADGLLAALKRVVEPKNSAPPEASPGPIDK
jgi:CheY-like chemotaxis protein